MAAARAEADADAYTVGQVAPGLTLTSGAVVTGVDFGHGVAGNRHRPVYAYVATHVARSHVFSEVPSAKAEPVPMADPLVYTTGVPAPVGASTFAHGVVIPAVSGVVSPVTPVPRTRIGKIMNIIKIIKGLVACADGEVYEECVEYGDEFGNYVECQQYVDCVATSTLV